MMQCARRAIATALLVVGSQAIAAAGAADTATDATAQPAQSAVEAPRWCRSGAFLDAIKLMNSAMRAHESLAQQNAAVARAELGSILSVAIKQASDEFHCVQGTLTHGYDASYGDAVRRAATTAQAMRLSAEVVNIARELAAHIESSGAPRR
jgi:hypothetical protein